MQIARSLDLLPTCFRVCFYPSRSPGQTRLILLPDLVVCPSYQKGRLGSFVSRKTLSANSMARTTTTRRRGLQSTRLVLTAVIFFLVMLDGCAFGFEDGLNYYQKTTISNRNRIPPDNGSPRQQRDLMIFQFHREFHPV